MDVMHKSFRRWVVALTVALFTSSSFVCGNPLTDTGVLTWLNESLKRIERKQVEGLTSLSALLPLLSGDVVCDNYWDLFDNKKCIALRMGTFNWESGKVVCKIFSSPNHPAKVLSIQSQEESDWIRTFLRGKVIYDVHATHWLNPNEKTNFSSWEEGFPANVSGHDCIQLSNSGQWRNVPCTGTKRLICERTPFSLNPVVSKVAVELSRLSHHYLQNPPVGFIYSQVTGHPSPQTLWPDGGEWKNVSEDDEGLILWKRTL